MKSILQENDAHYNPLDIAELVFLERDWSFDRASDGELIAETSGSWCKYHVWFTWQEDCGGLTLSCSIESKFPAAMMFKVHSLLALANEKIWLGHFDIGLDDGVIMFRHALLLSGNGSASHLAMELFKAKTGTEMQHVAFRGAAPLSR